MSNEVIVQDRQWGKGWEIVGSGYAEAMCIRAWRVETIFVRIGESKGMNHSCSRPWRPTKRWLVCQVAVVAGRVSKRCNRQIFLKCLWSRFFFSRGLEPERCATLRYAALRCGHHFLALIELTRLKINFLANTLCKCIAPVKLCLRLLCLAAVHTSPSPPPRKEVHSPLSPLV